MSLEHPVQPREITIKKKLKNRENDAKGVARPQHNAVAFGDLSDQTLGLIVRFKRRLQEGRRIFHRGLVPLS